ncbi:hypothetical protein LCGC14_1244180 [marine sediment metagenome]|uniref:Uncharacterized protein n=1 Tax=marine sediment metagenome TaxID=412755 RepID=A0A0F9LS54_9ZZZZ
MGSFILSGAAVRMAGNNVDVTQPEAFWTESISGAEATIMNVARDTFSGYDVATAKQQMIPDIASRLVAIDAWNSKPNGSDGSTTRSEYEDRISVLRDGVLRGISIIKGQKDVIFLKS